MNYDFCSTRPAFLNFLVKNLFRLINSSYFPDRLLLFMPIILIVYSSVCLAAQPTPISRSEVRNFITYMVNHHQYEIDELEKIFSQTNFRPDILKLISTPASAITWDEYRKRFVNMQRIRGGINFWNKHASELEQARKIYGIPEEIIVAIIGIETAYGSSTGTYRIMDALTTLAFDFPRRADYFREELEQYLLLAREQKFGLLDIKGSYAGAIGIPQFMPGSYRRYAVDFNHDGKIDLSGSAADAIGSIGNYLKEYGWEAGKPIAVRARIRSENFQKFLDAGIEPLHSVKKLREAGIIPLDSITDDTLSALLELNSQDNRQFWLGFRNFYAITRYNRSTFYAMSVFELARAIRVARSS
ncbi:lytic murein transglycosylase B [Nitrosomonas eutropha]|uniref:Membrane-bound lytic murein transglycosylase B n=3 Tax=Nitrosomonas eutropha TaxID=916 RepID=A0ABX5M982_9PROT|nr:lytic murein transglycosylase B [Nitrosomonas eutropha]ABI60685.1 lytic murein transglycosylase B [Nitrosomonas eutropha C91]PXV80211.1 membrane-bound lytic murein transglycosylase B [Nitrosomonas eutropha]